DAVASGDARAALHACARLAESGRDMGRFFGDLEAHARALMVVQVLGEVPPELRVTAEQDARLAEQAARVPGDAVVRLLELLAAAPAAPAVGAARGATTVSVAAQVEGQPPVVATTSLPGASADPRDAQAVADEAAASVAAELATEADPAPAVAAVAVVDPDAD